MIRHAGPLSVLQHQKPPKNKKVLLHAGFQKPSSLVVTVAFPSTPSAHFVAGFDLMLCAAPTSHCSAS